MLRRSFRFGLTVGILLGVAFALVKVLGGRRTSEPEPAPVSWPPLEPDPVAPVASPKPKKAGAPKKAAAPKTAWVEPSGDVCPTTHPVKAKLKSKIFHLPGMLNYDRTNPDRCYRDGDSAEADGLRPAKR